MGEEGREDVVLNSYKDTWITSLPPPCPNDPGGSIITNHFTVILGDKTEPGGATSS